MPVTTTVILQSPTWNNAGSGEQIYLPVSVAHHSGDSRAALLTLFQGENQLMDFGQLQEVLVLSGVLTRRFAVEHGYVDPLHMRDLIRRTRTFWPIDDWPIADTYWDNVNLPADQRDAVTLRQRGRARLIFDKTYRTTAGTIDTSSLKNFFLYGTVLNFRFGPMVATTNRFRLPYSITMAVGLVQAG